MSISPGTTSLPRASIVAVALPTMLVSTAAMRPRATATSRIPSMRREGSITRPPLMIRSYVAACANALGRSLTSVVPAAAAQRNWRRFMINTLRRHRQSRHREALNDGGPRLTGGYWLRFCECAGADEFAGRKWLLGRPTFDGGRELAQAESRASKRVP